MSENDDQVFAARFRALLDSPSHGVIEVDSTGVIRLVSCHAEAIFGYGHGKLLGQSIEVLVPQRVRDIHAEERMSYFECPQPRSMGRGIELTGRRRDGSEFPVEISLTPVSDSDGMRTIGMITDITQRVELEAHDWQTHKMESLGQLAAAVARQLNTLGSIISRHTTLALDGCDSDEALRSSLEELSTAAAEANSLARQLHTFSGSQVAEPVWFDPNARLSQMYRYLLGLVGEGIDLELALGEDLGELLADPGQWDQVILNLVQNAREAMPEGGRLRIETSAAEVDENENRWCLAVSPGIYVMLTVTDTGVGMRPEVQARMFEPFFTTKPSGDEAGNGLSAVYGILMAAGGSILASSRLNKGTTFQVIFPRLAVSPSKRDDGESISDME